jgi:hypothetical protein
MKIIVTKENQSIFLFQLIILGGLSIKKWQRTVAVLCQDIEFRIKLPV